MQMERKLLFGKIIILSLDFLCIVLGLERIRIMNVSTRNPRFCHDYVESPVWWLVIQASNLVTLFVYHISLPKQLGTGV